MTDADAFNIGRAFFSGPFLTGSTALPAFMASEADCPSVIAAKLPLGYGQLERR
jgi:hypothetical protein